MQIPTSYLLLFIAATWAMFIAVGLFARPRFAGEQVSPRFPERQKYQWTELRDLAVAKPDLARFYVWPVLFPLDLIVMLALAGSMGLASFVWLKAAGGWAWTAALLPAGYFLTDLVEDCLLATTLRNPARITEASVRRLKIFTKLKFWTIGLAIAQTIGVFAYYLSHT